MINLNGMKIDWFEIDDFGDLRHGNSVITNLEEDEKKDGMYLYKENDTVINLMGERIHLCDGKLYEFGKISYNTFEKIMVESKMSRIPTSSMWAFPQSGEAFISLRMNSKNNLEYIIEFLNNDELYQVTDFDFSCGKEILPGSYSVQRVTNMFMKHIDLLEELPIHDLYIREFAENTRTSYEKGRCMKSILEYLDKESEFYKTKVYNYQNKILFRKVDMNQNDKCYVLTFKLGDKPIRVYTDVNADFNVPFLSCFCEKVIDDKSAIVHMVDIRN